MNTAQIYAGKGRFASPVEPTAPRAVPLDGGQRPISNELFEVFKDNFSLIFDYFGYRQSPVPGFNAMFLSWLKHDYKPASEVDRKRVEAYLELLAFLSALQSSLAGMEFYYDANQEAGYSND